MESLDSARRADFQWSTLRVSFRFSPGATVLQYREQVRFCTVNRVLFSNLPYPCPGLELPYTTFVLLHDTCRSRSRPNKPFSTLGDKEMEERGYPGMQRSMALKSKNEER
eukprot:3765121-Rhodomonas_salina.4